MNDLPDSAAVGAVGTVAVVVLGWLSKWVLGRSFAQFDSIITSMGDIKERMIRVETQLGRLVSDAESEKRTRADANRTVHDRVSLLGERVAKLGG